eukprot:347178-Rhodomonas_salina.1
MRVCHRMPAPTPRSYRVRSGPTLPVAAASANPNAVDRVYREFPNATLLQILLQPSPYANLLEHSPKALQHTAGSTSGQGTGQTGAATRRERMGAGRARANGEQARMETAATTVWRMSAEITCVGCWDNVGPVLR